MFQRTRWPRAEPISANLCAAESDTSQPISTASECGYLRERFVDARGQCARVSFVRRNIRDLYRSLVQWMRLFEI